MKQQRRFFLKVLASGPLLGCAGAASEGSLSGGEGGSAAEPGSSAGGNLGNAGSGAGGSSSGGSLPASGGGTFVTGGRFGNTGTAGGSAAGGASAGATSVGGAGGSGSVVAGPGTPVGNVGSFPVGSLSIVEGIFFLGRDADGIYVMSMQCTHKGCVVALAAGELKCTCHESRFDSEGNVLQGPATTPLPHFQVYVDAAGNISVDRYTIVAVSARVAV